MQNNIANTPSRKRIRMISPAALIKREVWGSRVCTTEFKSFAKAYITPPAAPRIMGIVKMKMKRVQNVAELESPWRRRKRKTMPVEEGSNRLKLLFDSQTTPAFNESFGDLLSRPVVSAKYQRGSLDVRRGRE
jgi:hypothetical protein